MSSNRRYRKYQKTLDGYCSWIVGSLFRPKFNYDVGGKHPVEIMFDWESNGTKLSNGSNEPSLLEDYIQGKLSRDFHIREWKIGCEAGLFLPEEFLGILGVTEDNFSSIFGRPLNKEILLALGES